MVRPSAGPDPGAIPVTLEVNGAAVSLPVAPYVTLLDLLREQLQPACQQLGRCRQLRNGLDWCEAAARRYRAEAGALAL
jgi:aerobic-type carbon monoxide dehydrogenase small subunit (CoxS/CutS family)